MTSGGERAKRVAILFFSHVFDRTSLGHLRKLRTESADYGTFFIHADARGQNPVDLNEQVVRFDFETIRKQYPGALGDTLIPGNCHLVLLDFFRRHPQFDYYWVIEYDVAFTGHWGDVFSAFADNEADFVASHLRSYDEEPDWAWWSTLQAPEGRTVPVQRIRAFCPIQRVSRRALQELQLMVQEGWTGHFECLVPTLLRFRDYSLVDLGGDGSFVPSGFKNRFYTSISWRDGRLKFGSMRFRPPFASSSLSRSGTLYHPVKSAPLAMERVRLLLYTTRTLIAHPVGFGRALTRFYSS